LKRLVSMANNYKHKILLVDDDSGILKALTRLLKSLEVEIAASDSGAAALEKLRDFKPSVIISDQRMPQMTGTEFLRRSREVSPNSIRILLTGYSDIAATIEAINSGAVKYYINKPWNDDELVLKIKDCFGIYELTAENRRLTELTAEQNRRLTALNESLEQKVAEQTEEIRDQNEKLRRSFMETIQSLSTILEFRHRDVGSHSQRVATLIRELMKYLDISPEERQDIIIAGFLHDIGKIGIPDRIMAKKASELNRQDMIEIEQHTILGQSCIMSVSGFEEIGLYIRHHHENYDGSGYPNGLSGGQIPLGSRIIRLADAFEKNAFEKGYPNEKTLREASANLVRNSGSMFDPILVKKFIDNDIGQVFHFKDAIESANVRTESLREGMVVAEDIHSRSGMFLLPKGARLTSGIINRLVKIDRVDPIDKGVQIVVQRAGAEVQHAAV